MGLVLPLSMMLLAIAWVAVVATVVATSIPRWSPLRARHWRGCLVVTAALSALPFTVAFIGILDALSYIVVGDGSLVGPAALLLASLVAPLISWWMLKRTRVLVDAL